MRKALILLLTSVLLGSCASVKKYNKNLNSLKTENRLKSDVNYTYKKLQKLHPELYTYISKKELDFKFDSLKSTINAPMTSNDFFFKLSPVIASIRQGHTRLFPLYNNEINILFRKGYSSFFRFDFEIFNNKLYIINDHSLNKSVKAGTEVVSINNIPPQELFSKYERTFSSDGFNSTFIDNRLSTIFPIYFHYLNYKLDSAMYKLKYNDTIKTLFVRIDVPKIKSVTGKHKDSATIIYNKELKFLEPDSSIALMKLNNFHEASYGFYRNSFNKLNNSKTKYLILDLRDNLGGNLKYAKELYSYLVDKDFVFIDKVEVISKTSLLHNNYVRKFIKAPLIGKPFIIAFSPFRLIWMGVTFFKVKKDSNSKYYYSSNFSKTAHPKSNSFKGKVYVLINGGTYSASCILSSNLKGSNRALFVGEETGGAFNGTVAGTMPVFNLRKTKLNMQFGLQVIQPYYKTNVEGRGIFPDIEIKPRLEDRIRGNDPELKWVLDEIKGQHISNGGVN